MGGRGSSSGMGGSAKSGGGASVSDYANNILKDMGSYASSASTDEAELADNLKRRLTSDLKSKGISINEEEINKTVEQAVVNRNINKEDFNKPYQKARAYATTYNNPDPNNSFAEFNFKLWVGTGSKEGQKRVYISDKKARQMGYIDGTTGKVLINDRQGQSQETIDLAIKNFNRKYKY